MVPDRDPDNLCKKESHLCCHTHVEPGSTVAASHAGNALTAMITSEEYKSVADPTERSYRACNDLRSGQTLPLCMMMYAGDDFSDVTFKKVLQPRWEEYTGQKQENDHPHNWSNVASGRTVPVSAYTIQDTVA